MVQVADGEVHAARAGAQAVPHQLQLGSEEAATQAAALLGPPSPPPPGGGSPPAVAAPSHITGSQGAAAATKQSDGLPQEAAAPSQPPPRAESETQDIHGMAAEAASEVMSQCCPHSITQQLSAGESTVFKPQWLHHRRDLQSRQGYFD